MIPNGFTLLPTPLPPMLLKMAGVRVETRFVGLYYLGSKATWSDGRSSRSFPFYTVWQPYIRHPAMMFALAGLEVHLGADDLEPTHQLVCDQIKEQVYVAPWDEAERFLDAQHPPRRSPTPEEWQAVQALISALPQPSQEDMQQLGMFEWLSPPTPEMQARKSELVAWLNQSVDRGQIELYPLMLGLSQEETLRFWRGRYRAMNVNNLNFEKKLLSQRGLSLGLSKLEIEALATSLERAVKILRETEGSCTDSSRIEARKKRALAQIQYDLLTGFWQGGVPALKMPNLSDDTTWKWTVKEPPW